MSTRRLFEGHHGYFLALVWSTVAIVAFQLPTMGVTIEVGSLSAPEAAVPWIEKEIASFTKAYPDITVTTSPLSSPQRVKSPIYTGTPLARNVIGIDSLPGYETGYLVNKGMLLPINQFLPDPDFNMKDFPENYFDAVTYQGKVWGIPWLVTNDVLVCDMSLFKAAGIATPPVTWDELASCAGKIANIEHTDKITSPQGLRISLRDDTLGGMLVSYILQKNGQLMRNCRFELSDPGVAESIRFFYRLIFKTPGVKTDTQSIGAALEDQATQYGMHIVHVQDLKPVARNKDLRIVPLPNAGKDVTACRRRLYYAIRRTTTEEEQASWKFVKWMSRTDVSLPSFWEGFPCRSDITERSEFKAMATGGIQNLEVAVLSSGRSVDPGDQVINRDKGFVAVFRGLLPGLLEGDISAVAEPATAAANKILIDLPKSTETLDIYK